MDMVTKKPSMQEMSDHCRCFKMPYIICEVLSDHDELLSVILNDNELLS